MRIPPLTILCLILSLTYTSAQQLEEVNQLAEDLLESLAENGGVQNDYESTFRELVDLHFNKINLNEASREDLEKLFFLTDIEIENILYYIYRNGPLEMTFELQGVENLKLATIKKLLLFCDVIPLKENDLISFNGHSDLLIKSKTLLETPIGYKAKSDTTPSKYLGSKEQLYTRYSYKEGQRLSMGVTFEKDPGEKLAHSNAPYVDFLSAHCFYQNNTSLHKLALGDYKVSIGQGLVLGQYMAFGKGVDIMNIRRRGGGIEKYTSAGEYGFFRGTAATFQKGNFRLSTFASYRALDATLIQASNQNHNVISSISETGYHRTESEILKKRNTHETYYGTFSEYNQRFFSIGLAFTGYHYQYPFNKTSAVQDIFNNRRQSGTNSSLYYKTAYKKLLCFGEVAISSATKLAVTNGLIFQPIEKLAFAINYRYINQAYYAPRMNTFGASSNTTGEQGFYTGATLQLGKYINLTSYVDFFSYKWLRYGVDAPSNGKDFLTQITFQLNPTAKIYIRFQEKSKEENSNTVSPDISIHESKLQKIRLHFNHTIASNWRLDSRVEQSTHQKADIKSHGYLIYQDIKYKTKSAKWGFSLRYGLFDTDNYNVRIYAYEQDMLYTFSIPAYFSKGQRIYFNFHIKPQTRIDLWFRIARTIYSHQNEIGTGNDLIKGNKKSEIKFQCRFRF